jgi:hypothetical protein
MARHLDPTLTLRGYWDYDPLIDDRLRPLRGREPHSFLFSKGGKNKIHSQIISRLYTTLINLSLVVYREREIEEAFKLSSLPLSVTVRRAMSS